MSVTRRSAIFFGGLGLLAGPRAAETAQASPGSQPSVMLGESSLTVLADDYAGAGDGTAAGTAALQSAFTAAQGKTLVFGREKTYVVASTILAPKNMTLQSNGSRLAKSAVGFSAIRTNDGFKADVLDVLVQGHATTNDQGVYVMGRDVHIGHLRVASAQGDTPGLNGVIIGNAQAVNAPAFTNVRIERLEVSGFQRPIRILNLADSSISNIDVRNFVVGVYLQNNVSNVTFQRANISGTSPSSSRGPFSGMNGLLIESAADFNTCGLRFHDWTVDGAPEHSFRIGGGCSIADITFTDCTSRNPGNAPGNVSTGGGAFKALGAAGHWHANLRYINCLAEDSNTDAVGINNFSQFSFGLCEDVALVAPVVRKRNKLHSAHLALFLSSVRHVDLVNPNFRDTKRGTVFIGKDGPDSSMAGVSDIRWTGGLLDTAAAGAPCLRLDTQQTVTKNIYINDVTCSRGQAAWRTEKAVTVGGETGAYTNVNISIFYQDAPTRNASPPVQTGNLEVTHQYSGPVYGSVMGGRNGSRCIDQTTGQTRIRKADQWSLI